MKGSRPLLHPFLLAAFPILSLLAANINQIALRQGLRALLLSLLAAAILLVALGRPSRDWQRAGLTTSLIVTLFFAFGHIYKIVLDLFSLSNTLSVYGGLLLAWLLLLGIALWAIWRRWSGGATLPQALNYAAAAMLILPIYTLTMTFVEAGSTPESSTSLPVPTEELTPSDMPDIYYIVLDGYARSDILARTMRYDNSQTVNELTARGFTVAAQSRSNYVGTIASLAASLNFEYVNDLTATMGPESTNLTPLTNRVRQNRVLAFLKRLGYQTVTISSGYENTEVRQVDHYLASSFRGINRFETLLLQHTPLGRVLVKPSPLMPSGLQYAPRRERIRFAFDSLVNTAPAISGPKFVFSHIVAPHPPFVFDENGRAVQPDYAYTLKDGSHFPGSPEEYIAGYTAQLTYVNEQLLTAVDAILTQNGRPAVIIIQSDHGSGAFLEWDAVASNSCLKERIANFTAIRLPDGDRAPLYDAITPVNIFRILFDTYFHTELGLLADRSYFASPETPYQFVDISDQVTTSDTCLVQEPS